MIPTLPMNPISPKISRLHSAVCHTATNAFVAAVLLLLSAASAAAGPAQPGAAEKLKEAVAAEKPTMVAVAGSANNTISNIVFNDDGTISIESNVVGELSHVGEFTGRFSYLATPSPVSIELSGTAVLTNEDGDKLFFSVHILEVGTDYPYTLLGNLMVTGGTGRFVGATGSIAVSGMDTASLTDKLVLRGVLTLRK